jgi:hypothetical protein
VVGVYLSANEKSLELELFIIFCNLFSFSFEIVAWARNFYYYMSDLEHVTDVIFRFWVIAFIIYVWNQDQLFTDSAYIWESCLVALVTTKIIFSLDFLPSVHEFILFLDRGMKDMTGLFIIVIMFVIGIGYGYYTILRGSTNSNTNAPYTATECIALVAVEAVGGYQNLPGNESYGALI